MASSAPNSRRILLVVLIVVALVGDTARGVPLPATAAAQQTEASGTGDSGSSTVVGGGKIDRLLSDLYDQIIRARLENLLEGVVGGPQHNDHEDEIYAASAEMSNSLSASSLPRISVNRPKTKEEGQAGGVAELAQDVGSESDGLIDPAAGHDKQTFLYNDHLPPGQTVQISLPNPVTEIPFELFTSLPGYWLVGEGSDVDTPPDEGQHTGQPGDLYTENYGIEDLFNAS